MKSPIYIDITWAV